MASFDVFDTVLTRSVASPHAVFLLLGRWLQVRGLGRSTPEAFARHRLAADRRAFRNAGGRDSHITLKEIYDEFGSAFGLTSAVRDQMIESELRLEAELFRCLPSGRAAVESARAAGHRIIFVSDTYLPSTFLEEQLRRHGVLGPGDHVYVSNHHGAAKSTGRLFAEVLRLEHVRAAEVVHHGNDLSVDIIPAKRLGITTRHLPGGNPNRFEEYLEARRWETEGLSSLLAGASRLARCTVSAPDPLSRAVRDTTAGVAGPLLVAYVLWVLQQASRHGVDRLYFLARDGQQLLRIATVLAERIGVGCDLRYLCGSRQVLNLAAAGELSEQTAPWLLSHGAQGSIRSILARLNLDAEAVATELESAGFFPERWSEQLTTSGLTRLMELLTRDDLATIIRGRARIARREVQAYLAQEGFLASGRVGIVDLGGVASQFVALSEFRAQVEESAPIGFLAYRERAEPWPASATDAGCAALEVFLFDAVHGRGIERFAGLVPFLEVFCTADHGTTIGYRCEGDRVEPTLATQPSGLVGTRGFRLMRETIDCFTDDLVIDREIVALHAGLRATVTENLRQFVLTPTIDEARAWGSFPFEALGTGAVRTLAESWSLGDVARRLMGRPLPGDWFTWRDGSRLVSSPPARKVLGAAGTARHVTGRLARWYTRTI